MSSFTPTPKTIVIRTLKIDIYALHMKQKQKYIVSFTYIQYIFWKFFLLLFFLNFFACIVKFSNILILPVCSWGHSLCINWTELYPVCCYFFFYLPCESSWLYRIMYLLLMEKNIKKSYEKQKKRINTRKRVCLNRVYRIDIKKK